MHVAQALMLSAALAGADLSWLSGYWLACDGGEEVFETWSAPRQGLLLGMSMAEARGKLTWEHARIAPVGESLVFFAQPSGQQAAEFKAVELKDRRVVFENPAHDFPQRVIYARDGATLVGRIEGRIGGKLETMEWRYKSAPLNSRCPR